MAREQSVDVLVIGGGQTGLAMGYQLQRSGCDFAIIDSNQRIGETWRNRWDSLKLLTPARYSGLPGKAFPAAPLHFALRDEYVAYLEDYAKSFNIPVQHGVTARRLELEQDGFRADCGDVVFHAAHVVVATGPWSFAIKPEAAKEIDKSVAQMHACDYQRPSQLADGPVLVVGGGNSGVEIAYEAAKNGHETWLAGPLEPHALSILRLFGGRLFWFYATHIASRRHPIGRLALAWMKSRGSLLLRYGEKELLESGVKIMPRFASVKQGLPVMEDGTALEPASIVWCTGFVQDFSWISPEAKKAKAIHFVALPYQNNATSHLIGGVGRETAAAARRIERALVRKNAPAAEAAPA